MNETSAEPPLAQTGHRIQGVTLMLGRQSKQVVLIVRQLQVKAGW